MNRLKDCMTTREAADLTGYNVKYLRNLVRRGRVEARKVGRDWLVNRESLLAYKRRMDRLGPQKHNPWRDDLAEAERGRDSKQMEERENAVTSD